MNAAVLQEDERDWVRAHEALSRLARERAAADAEEGRWLLAAFRSAAHVHMGFGSFGEYVERLFGYGRRCTQEKLRVAGALERLPALAVALEQGALSWSAVRELTRVATLETERAWLEVAHGKTVRQLEELVARRREGDTPDAPPDPALRRHVLRLEVSAETLALFRQAFAELRRRVGGSIDDDASLSEMARCVLHGSSDEGRSSYQIALTVCATCGAGSQEANGELLRVVPEIVAMASCDAQHLGRVDQRPANDASSRESVAERAEKAESLASAESLETPEKAESLASAESAESLAGAESAESAESLAGAESAESAESLAGAESAKIPKCGKTPRVRAHVGARAKQSIPPAVRRCVLRRDHGRCRVPGCRNATFLDVHHIELRSEGGSHSADNLLTVCGAHHRALHRGELVIEGTSAGNSRFRHANGALYGKSADPRALDVQARVFGALRNLGFREGEVRRVLAQLRADFDSEPASAGEWLRAAVQRLTLG